MCVSVSVLFFIVVFLFYFSESCLLNICNYYHTTGKMAAFCILTVDPAPSALNALFIAFQSGSSLFFRHISNIICSEYLFLIALTEVELYQLFSFYLYFFYKTFLISYIFTWLLSIFHSRM